MCHTHELGVKLGRDIIISVSYLCSFGNKMDLLGAGIALFLFVVCSGKPSQDDLLEIVGDLRRKFSNLQSDVERLQTTIGIVFVYLNFVLKKATMRYAAIEYRQRSTIWYGTAFSKGLRGN